MAGSEISVDYVDWGDVIEAVKPTVGRPFRLEVTLYASAAKGAGANETMTRYTMALLENPSSPDALQGTNSTTAEFGYATIVSTLPAMTIQNLGSSVPADEFMVWIPAGYWQLSDGTDFVQSETTASVPKIDGMNNITYVDVQVVAKGGGRR